MANTSKINGFRPVKHVTGAPYNGQANIYGVASGDSTALFVGDVVKLAADGNAAGIQYVTAHAAGVAGTGQPALGVVVGVINTKLDPVDGRTRVVSPCLRQAAEEHVVDVLVVEAHERELDALELAFLDVLLRRAEAHLAHLLPIGIGRLALADARDLEDRGAQVVLGEGGGDAQRRRAHGGNGGSARGTLQHRAAADHVIEDIDSHEFGSSLERPLQVVAVSLPAASLF